MTSTAFEMLCRCGDLLSDHETASVLTPEQIAEIGSPCNRCNADPNKDTRRQYGMFCTGFSERPIGPLPYPGSYEALYLGCACPVEVNVRRVAEKLQPIYALSCSIHDWICKRAGPCEHLDPNLIVGTDGKYTIEHRQSLHQVCEHCTIPRIVCDQCGRMWLDWRLAPQRIGWVLRHPETANLKPVWYCNTCSTQSSQSSREENSI